MIKRLKYRVIWIIPAILCCTFSLSGQVLKDTVAVKMIRSGIDDMYNLKFAEANEIFYKISRMYPGHPVNYLLHGLVSYWENYPLVPSSPARETFEDDMRECIRLSEEEPYSTDNEAESLLANICSRGLLSLFYSDNDLVWNVIPLVTSTYKYLRKSFDFVNYCSDLYYFTGLYNYYREAYPKIHPVYKTLAGLFPPGDMVKGLTELSISAKEAIFLKAESYSMLTWIYTGYENDYKKASGYSKTLTDSYPENLYFRALHIKNLLLTGEYDNAESLIKTYRKDSVDSFFYGQAMIFNGIVLEKKYRNYKLAEQFYEEGINTISLYGKYGDEFCGYAYFGLSRICEHNGDKSCRKTYRRKGSDLVSFKKINFD